MAKLILILIIVNSLLGCFSPPPTASSFYKIQRLDTVQEEKIERYNSATEKFFVDSFTADSENYMVLEPYSQSLVVMKLIYLFGLEDFTIIEKRNLALSIFGKIPDGKESAVIGNLVVPRWFENGEPLIVSFTKVCKWRKKPKIVVITNTVPLLQNAGDDFVRKTPVQLVKYPQVIQQDAERYYLGGDTFEFVIEEDGLLQDSSFVRAGDDEISSAFRDFDEKIMAKNLIGGDIAAKNSELAIKNGENPSEADKLWALRGMGDTISLIRELTRSQNE